MGFNEKLQNSLKRREENCNKRSLNIFSHGVDFYSNDYLGFSTSGSLIREINDKVKPRLFSGSTGARLISGNSKQYEELEAKVASYHKGQAGLIFNSGYNATLSVFSAIPKRHDTIIYDEQCHASIRDGIRLSNARSYSFRHNDIKDLERKISKARGDVFIGAESLYSMDGDTAPLYELVEISDRTGAHLIVDEAHATGLFGEGGKGLVVECGLEEKIPVRIHTFGKALGVFGGAVVGSDVLKDYLINFARPFIYTTALPPYIISAIDSAYDLLERADLERARIVDLGRLMLSCLTEQIGLTIVGERGPIFGVVVPGSRRCKEVSTRLQKSGFLVKDILSPTVPEGRERLRILVHSFNTPYEIESLISELREIL